MTCIPYREKDCLKLYVTEFFFFWKILVTWNHTERIVEWFGVETDARGEE